MVGLGLFGVLPSFPLADMVLRKQMVAAPLPWVESAIPAGRLTNFIALDDHLDHLRLKL